MYTQYASSGRAFTPAYQFKYIGRGSRSISSLSAIHKLSRHSCLLSIPTVTVFRVVCSANVPILRNTRPGWVESAAFIFFRAVFLPPFPPPSIIGGKKKTRHPPSPSSCDTLSPFIILLQSSYVQRNLISNITHG